MTGAGPGVVEVAGARLEVLDLPATDPNRPAIRMLHEGLGHAILHAARGIRRLQLRYHASGPRGNDATEFDQGCVADRTE